MRQVNFTVIFVICLALVLFSIENTDPAVIHIIQGLDLTAPLSVELIVAMGVGAVMAWVFSVWTQVQKMLESGRELERREARIQELEEDVQRYKVELEEQRRLLPASKDPAAAEDVEVLQAGLS